MQAMSAHKAGGFPKRKSESARYGEAPVQPSSAAKSSSMGVKEEGPGAFLEYIHCNLCNYPFYGEHGRETREFFMTSCGHIVCNDPSHNHKKERCTVCGKGGEDNPVEVTAMDDQMPVELQNWFMGSSTSINIGNEFLMRTKFQTKELIRHIRYQETVISMKQDLLNRVTPEIKAYKQLQEDHKKLEAVHAQAQKELAELKRKIAFGDYQPVHQSPRVSAPPASEGINGGNMVPGAYRQHPDSSRIHHIPHRGYMNKLTPLLEEDEGRDAVQTGDEVPSKRPRYGDLSHPRPTPPLMHGVERPLVPLLSSASTHLGGVRRSPYSIRQQESWYPHVNQQQPVQETRTTPRPQSCTGPRTNLEQFRYDGSTTPQPPSSRAFHPRRPSSVIPTQRPSDHLKSRMNDTDTGPNVAAQSFQGIRSKRGESSRRLLM